MTPPSSAKTRTIKETLLIVCEGDAEIEFVRFVKRTYADALGRAVQETNAKGKGGKHVLEVGIRRARNNRAFDKLILLLDTDQDWDDKLRAKARNTRIGKHTLSVIESSPCLEAWLLQILDATCEGDTRQLKQKFKEHTLVEAHDPTWMARFLNRNLLDKAREQVPQLAELMNHMGIAKNRGA